MALERQRLRAGFDIFCLRGQDLQQVVRSYHIQTALGARTWGSGVAQDQLIAGSHGVPVYVPQRKDKGLRDRSFCDSERVCETHRQGWIVGAFPRSPDAALDWLWDPGQASSPLCTSLFLCEMRGLGSCLQHPLMSPHGLPLLIPLLLLIPRDWAKAGLCSPP